MSEFEKSKELKLCYFNGKGLAETSRLLLAFAGVDYEDFRYPIEMKSGTKVEFDNDKKDGKLVKSLNKLPYLEINGDIICQSKAIERFISKKYGMMGDSDIEEAKIDSICETIRDFKTEYQSVRKLKEEEKESGMNKWFNETLPMKLEVLDVLIGNVYSVGNKVSLADISIFSFITQFFDNKELAFNSMKDAGNIRSVVENVNNQESISKWLNDRPQTLF